MATSEKISICGESEQTYFATKLNAFKYCFKWIIPNFEFVCGNVKVIRSPEFSTKNLENGKWIITMEPTELVHNSKDVFKIHLHYDTDIIIKDKKLLNVQISLLRCDNGRKIILLNTDNAEQGDYNLSWKINGSELFEIFSNSAPKDSISLVPNRICVIFEIDVVLPKMNLIQKPLIDIEKCNGLMENMISLQENEEFKDVAFKIEDEEFTAHKNILASQSPVFAAMFKNKMTEGLTSVVEIDDIKPAIFQQMLNFIYTDRLENLEESAIEFLYVAEKYQLEKLKNLCINSLNNKLSLKSVIKTLEVAELYSVELLKNECLKFINDKRYEIIETKEFQELLLSRPNLSIDIFKIKETRSSSYYGSYELK
ncbi:speckle-type POZ protein-like [Leptopilina heterotoma]|uniref:speckle-type POZ protein-like n=1 Tax=Leptopilina heterotoma TaxID=63436 RepID=UPI001CA8028E|nr:speckle-type POZ protein-like [Leptopilina heterotoma]